MSWPKMRSRPLSCVLCRTKAMQKPETFHLTHITEQSNKNDAVTAEYYENYFHKIEMQALG